MSPLCPICKRAAEARFRPFCSSRCADLDLGRWLRGSYVVSGEDGEAAEESVGLRPERGAADPDEDAVD